MINSLSVEESVIGAILYKPEMALPVARTLLTADSFGNDFCRKAFIAAEQLTESGIPVDAVTMGAKLGPECAERLGEFLALTPTANNITVYCQYVIRQAAQRQIRDAVEEAGNEITVNHDPQDILINLRERLDNVTGAEGKISRIITPEAAASNFINYFMDAKAAPGSTCLTTDFPDLDRKLGGGLFKSGMYIIGARPGMGKTTLGINLAENIAKRGEPVLLFSLEMSEEQIMAKRVAIETGWSYTNLISGRLSDGYINDLTDTLERMQSRPFYLVTDSSGKLKDIKSQCYQIKNLKCVIIDYLGLMHLDDENQYRSRYEETTEISGELKKLAKRLKLPIIVLCQLNRENMTTKDKRPNLQYLRDSGAIEQDADCVILLHRPMYYEEQETPPPREEIEIIVAKNRHGPTGTVKMVWEGVSGKIMPLAN